MKNTEQYHFADISKMMEWREANCRLCTKAVKTERAKTFRCAIDRDITIQRERGESYHVSERSVRIVNQGGQCPYLRLQKAHCVKTDKADEEAAETAEIAANAAEEEEKREETPAQTQEQHQNEEEKQNEHSKEHYPTRPVTPALEEARRIAAIYGYTEADCLRAEKKVLDTIFDGRVNCSLFHPTSSIERKQASERAFRQHVATDVRRMLENLSWDDCMKVCFVPIVIGKVAWWYAEKATAAAAAQKISRYVKLCREVRELRRKYNDFITQDIPYQQLRYIEKQAETLIHTCSSHFAILWFQLSNYIKTNAYGTPYEDVCTHAMTSITIVRFLEDYNKRISREVCSKMNLDRSLTDPNMLRLGDMMKRFLPADFPYGTNANIDMCERIFHNDLLLIEFEQGND